MVFRVEDNHDLRLLLRAETEAFAGIGAVVVFPAQIVRVERPGEARGFLTA